MKRSIAGAAAWAMAAALPAVAQTAAAQAGAAAPAGLTVDRVVLMMRHGVRPPTKVPPMPAGVAAQAWPEWPVAPGYLTPHGAAALARLGTADRAGFAAAGLLPKTGCPRPGAVRIIADSDERTIATAVAWGAAVAPGCTIASEHRAQDDPDPLFSPIGAGTTLDPARAEAAVLAGAGPGGIAGEEARLRPVLTRLDAILCGAPAATACGIAAAPSALAPARPGARPKLTGALDRGATAAQILLLEYAEAMPAAMVGWGRATAADVAALSDLHATEFRLLARPPYIAARNLAGLAPRIIAALGDADGAAITMISGHDTNVANLGGLLGVHWQAPGLAQDDPIPGGALVLERLHDAAGAQYVRALYRSQSLDQIRAAAPVTAASVYRVVLPIPGCSARGVAGLCTEAAFRTIMAPALATQ